MKLNLRRPTLVITGLWNPHIFQPPWVAATLLNVPSGNDVVFVEVVEPPAKVAHYYGDVGISVPPGRLELLTNVGGSEGWKELENLAAKIVDTLPHTPIQALGINFRFEDDDPEPTVIDKLWTQEGLETRFTVISSTVRNRLRFDDCELGLTREITEGGNFNVDFNFHHADMSAEKLTGLLPGAIADRLARACSILSELYDVEVEEAVLSHQLHPAG